MDIRKQLVLETLAETGVVAIVRVDDAADLLEVAQALSDGGVRMFEITMTVPGALDTIRSVHSRFQDRVLVGAGTVLDATTARLAILSGASYVVSPCFVPDLVQLCKLYDVAMMPGCLTPTEVVTAWKAGADVVKMFPGRIATPDYFRELKGPLPQVRMMPTGNVDRDTAAEYIKAGAIAVGVGKALVDLQALRERRFDAIAENARAFCKIVSDARRASQ